MDQLVLLRRSVMIFRQRAKWAVLVGACFASSSCNLNPRPEDPGFGNEDPRGLLGAGADDPSSEDSDDTATDNQGGQDSVNEPPPFSYGGSGGGAESQGSSTGSDAGVVTETSDEVRQDAGADAQVDAGDGASEAVASDEALNASSN